MIYANPDYYPPTVNAVHLLSEHFDIVLIGRNYEPTGVTYPNNVIVHRLGNYSSEGVRRSLSFNIKLWEYFQFIHRSHGLLQEVDFLYVYEPFAFIAGYLYKLRFNQNIPIIYHCHEVPDNLSPLSSLTGWVQQLEKLWVNKVVEVIQPEKERAIHYQQLIGLKTAPIIVPNYPLSSFFNFDLEWNNLIHQRWNKPTLFYRGSISNNISMFEIIQSLKLLLVNTSTVLQCNFVGFLNKNIGEDLDREVARLDLKNNFSYLGRVTLYQDVQKVTLSAFIGFCLYKSSSKGTQYTVTSSNKIYEYAACGLPVIVSDFPNYREFLGNESWVRFANPDDPQAIANAIKDILSNFEDYQKMCLAARQAFEEKFNYETVFTPLLNKIISLVEK